MTSKVTIILPTYNRASEVPNIIHAIQHQSYGNLELVVVNDGSGDNTRTVLADISASDDRIVVVNKENGGLSSARNAGIDVATGDYILFVDDDDNIPRDYVEKFMVPEYDGVDLVIDSYSNQLDNSKPEPVHFPNMRLDNRKTALEYIFGIMQEYPYCFFAHGKRFKSDIIQKHSLKFSEIIQFVEDRPFVLDYLWYCRRIAVIDNHSYIVKSVSSTSYRLSKGRKPLDYLCRNIKASYSYLIDYHKKTGIDSVKVYADNYLADKIYDYVLKPYSSASTAMDRRLIASSFMPLLKAVSTSNIRHLESRLVAWSLLAIGVRGTLATVRLRLNAGDILRNIIRRRS